MPDLPQLMSSYERQAWTELIKEVRRNDKHKIPGLDRFNERAATIAGHAEHFLEDHRNVGRVLTVAAKPLKGLSELVMNFGMDSVSVERIVKKAQKTDSSITSLRQFSGLDLKTLDGLSHGRQAKYATILALEGAATSLAITGAVVPAAVAAGPAGAAGVFGAAIAADVSINLAAATRIVAKVAATYGYDASGPEERLFALGVLNFGYAMSSSGKAAALAQLSRLVNVMMRRPTWAVLDKFALVAVTKAVYRALGIRLTQTRLAQAIPVIGAFFNAGVNAEQITRLERRAVQAYRLRFLTDKHGLDPTSWLGTDAPQSDPGSIDITAVVDQVRAAEDNDDSDEDR